MKKTSAKIERYTHGKYYIDIIETKDMFGAWITGKNCGISSIMFNVPKKNFDNFQPVTIDKEFFLQLVEVNLPEYIDIYNMEYMEA